MAHRKTQTEWETEMSEKILEHTRNEIYLELRFLEIALSQLVPKADGTVQTFATDGAYLCFSKECFEKAVKNKGLERSFKQAIPKEVYEKLEKEMNALEIE